MKDFIAEFTLLFQATAASGQGLILALSNWQHWSPEAQAVAHTVLGILTAWQAMIAKAHMPKEQQIQAAELSELLAAYRKNQGLAPAPTVTVTVDQPPPSPPPISPVN